jgi:hypothetical protein
MACGIRDSSVSIVTGQTISLLLFPSFLDYCVHTLWGPPFYLMGTVGSLYRGQATGGMRGAVPPLPHITSLSGTLLSTETVYLYKLGVSKRFPSHQGSLRLKEYRNHCARLQRQYSPDIQGVSFKMQPKQP